MKGVLISTVAQCCTWQEIKKKCWSFVVVVDVVHFESDWIDEKRECWRAVKVTFKSHVSSDVHLILLSVSWDHSVHTVLNPTVCFFSKCI